MLGRLEEKNDFNSMYVNQRQENYQNSRRRRWIQATSKQKQEEISMTRKEGILFRNMARGGDCWDLDTWAPGTA